MWRIPGEHLVLADAIGVPLTIDYPQDGSIFPPEITPPTFIWRDADASAKTWRIEIDFADGGKPLQATSKGEPMQILPVGHGAPPARFRGVTQGSSGGGRS